MRVVFNFFSIFFCRQNVQSGSWVICEKKKNKKSGIYKNDKKCSDYMIDAG